MVSKTGSAAGRATAVRRPLGQKIGYRLVTPNSVGYVFLTVGTAHRAFCVAAIAEVCETSCASLDSLTVIRCRPTHRTREVARNTLVAVEAYHFILKRDN